MDSSVEGSSGPLNTVLTEIATRLTDRGRRTLGARSSQLLEQLTAAAVQSVPGAAYAGLTMQTGDGLTSQAPSHAEITDLDRLQADIGEGPCVDAMKPGTSLEIYVRDFALEARWPRFAPAAVEMGARSLLSFAMAPYESPPAALNLYGVVPDAFDDSSRAIAAVFAAQAAVAVHGAAAVAELEHALATRDVIGRAKGIVMERFGLDDGEAFNLLARYSQHTNTKLHDVARQLSDSIARSPGS